jgi:hypothetical protein
VLAQKIDCQQCSPVGANSAAKTPAPQCGGAEDRPPDDRQPHKTLFPERPGGDAVLVAAGLNLLKLLRTIAHALIFWLRIIVSHLSTPRVNRCRIQIAAS